MTEEKTLLEKEIEALVANATPMYIVYQTYYIEDYYDVESDFLVTEDEELAKTIVENLNSIGKRVKVEQDKFVDFRDKWFEDNKIKLEELEPDQRWEAGLSLQKITQAMVTKRRILRERNSRIKERNSKLECEHEKKMQIAYDEYAKTNNLVYIAEEILQQEVLEYGYHKIDKI